MSNKKEDSQNLSKQDKFLNLTEDNNFIWTAEFDPTDQGKSNFNPLPSTLDIEVENNQLIYMHIGATLKNWFYRDFSAFTIERGVGLGRRRRKDQVECEIMEEEGFDPRKTIIFYHHWSQGNENRQTDRNGVFKFDLHLENWVEEGEGQKKLTKVIIDPVIVNGGGDPN